MSKEIPYQLSVNQLQDALDHIMRLAKASRSQTKRLKVIAARAEMALNGEVYDDANLKLPKEARSPMSYETELRVTKRELADALQREQVLAGHTERLNALAKAAYSNKNGWTIQDLQELGRAAMQEQPSASLAQLKDKAQYDLIDGLLLNHTQFIPESAGPIVELLLQIQEGLRPQGQSTQREEDAAA